MSFLELEGFHVFITGAAGGIATAAVKEFLCMLCTYYLIQSVGLPKYLSDYHL